jgi:hypothetical protein
MKQSIQNLASPSFFPSSSIKDEIGDSFRNLPMGYFDTLGTSLALSTLSPYTNIPYTSITDSVFQDLFSRHIPTIDPVHQDLLRAGGTLEAWSTNNISSILSYPSAASTTPASVDPDPLGTFINSLPTPAPIAPDPLGSFIDSLPTPAPVAPDPLGSFIDSLPTPAPVAPDPLGSFIDSLPTPAPSSPTPDVPDAPDPGDDTTSNDGLSDGGSDGRGDRGDPIVIDLTGNGFNLLDAETSSAHFDILGGGKQYKTGWTGEGNGLLAYDIDNDSLINHRSEIAFIDYKPGAKTDLEGLTAFDTNQNGWFEKTDDKWNQFGVWEDKNVDGITDQGEYRSLDSLGIQSIYLTSDHQQSVMNGNIIHGVTQVVMQNGSSLLAADVSFNVSNQVLM